MGAELTWGRKYLMTTPDHYRIEYAINPYMDPADQPDAETARRQWHHLHDTLVAVGAQVEVIDGAVETPDMVYAMNLGFAFAAGAHAAPQVALSAMRHPQRRGETVHAQSWFEDAGFLSHEIGAGNPQAFFEAGDAFPFADAIVCGYGKRTGAEALYELATLLDVPVRGFEITHPSMYHLDLAFCPLDSTRAMVCPEAFDAASAAALLELIPEPLVLTVGEALAFTANSVVVGQTVVMPTCPDRIRGRLERWGFEVVEAPVTEFHKGGGSVRCLTNPLDIVLARDLGAHEGADVIVAS